MPTTEQERAGRWFFEVERRAILPIKWLLFLLCFGLVYINSPYGIPPRDLFYCLLAFFVCNCLFSYLIVTRHVPETRMHLLSYLSYAADVLVITLFVYLVGKELGGEQGIGGEFYVLFFLVLLRGSASFPSTRMSLAVNVAISLVFITTLLASSRGPFFSWERFVSRAILLAGVMLLSWFLMDVLSAQNRRILDGKEALTQQFEYNQRLLESMADGVVAVDRDMRITSVNDAAREILSLEGTPADPVYPVGEDVLCLPREIAEALRMTLEEGMLYTNQVMEVTSRDEERITLRFSTRVFRTGGGSIAGIVAVFEDISVLRRLEEQMIRSEKLASVGELAAGVAHELGNPIGIIKSCAAYMKDKWDEITGGVRHPEGKPEVSDEISVILSQSERCQDLLQQLLSLSSRAAPRITDVPVAESIDRAVALVRYQKESEGITFESLIGPETGSVRADENMLGQALVNVLVNAVQSMDGRGQIVMSADRITPPLGKRGKTGSKHRIAIKISDQGCGIPPDRIGQIFDPFFTTKDEGTGLGLSITHGLIERMGGKISVESEVGKGTILAMELPAAEASPEEKPGPSTPGRTCA